MSDPLYAGMPTPLGSATLLTPTPPPASISLFAVPQSPSGVTTDVEGNHAYFIDLQADNLHITGGSSFLQNPLTVDLLWDRPADEHIGLGRAQFYPGNNDMHMSPYGMYAKYELEVGGLFVSAVGNIINIGSTAQNWWEFVLSTGTLRPTTSYTVGMGDDLHIIQYSYIQNLYLLGGLQIIGTQSTPAPTASTLTITKTTATTATAGGSGAPPAQVAGYFVWSNGTTTVKVPFYAN